MNKKFIKHYIIIGVLCIIISFFLKGTPSSLMIGAGLGFFVTALIAKFEKEDKVDPHPNEKKDQIDQNNPKKKK